MRFISLFLLALTALYGKCSSDSVQESLDHLTGKSTDYYEFKWPIRRVAIVGAGVGGMIAYRELTEAGFNAHIYERDYAPGGNWHYTDEIPVDAAVPTDPDVSIGDYTPSLPPAGVAFPYVEEYDDEEQNKIRRRAHRAPKPVWESLASNAPAPVQQIREFPWPIGTPWELPNQILQRYLRAFASWHNVNVNDRNSNVSYNTRVELAEKRYNEDGEEIGWTIIAKTLAQTGSGSTRATWTKENYDAIVVATGRYNAPNIPYIEGVSEWANRFPDQITHSRQYRHPQPFANKTVLIIGAATSGGEISREVVQRAKKVYQSVRPDKSPIKRFPQEALLRRLPQNVTIIPEIRRFLPIGPNFNEGQVELLNGTVISGIDRIVFATGYRYTYPFLPHYHNSSIGLNETSPEVVYSPIVTDGTHLRSLYLDVFYIPDPTLVFINANFGMQSFTHAEFTSLAIAKVWAGKADLPSTRELWRRYREVYKERKGYGRHFQFLGADRTREMLRFYLGWLNEAAVKYGGKQIDGMSQGLTQIHAVWTKARFGENFSANHSLNASLSLLGSDGRDNAGYTSVQGSESWAQDAVYNDYW